MGHLVGKEALYQNLGKTIDGSTVRAPWNETLYSILQELYSTEDAELIVKLPYRMSTIDRIGAITRIPRAQLEHRLASLCSRGLVMDIEIEEKMYYTVSPLAIGIFELTMMRSGGADFKKLAKLFADYFPEFFKANYGNGQRISLFRVLPHEGSLGDHVEVLDYEKATRLIEQSDRYAVGVCSCRHEHEHLGDRSCTAPLETCSLLGKVTVELMVRNGFAREVSKTEMLEILARSRELGLVFSADNVQQDVQNICHCCSCCCNILKGVNRFGYPNALVSSNYFAGIDLQNCKGCKVCSDKCPVQAIQRVNDASPQFQKHGRPEVDDTRCLGCGVCALKCRQKAIRLEPRKRRVWYPDNAFEKAILQCLEQGTLQNQFFDNPESKTHAFLRAVVGGFLRLAPVKQALMSDLLRSRFLKAMLAGGPV